MEYDSRPLCLECIERTFGCKIQPNPRFDKLFAGSVYCTCEVGEVIDLRAIFVFFSQKILKYNTIREAPENFNHTELSTN